MLCGFREAKIECSGGEGGISPRRRESLFFMHQKFRLAKLIDSGCVVDALSPWNKIWIYLTVNAVNITESQPTEMRRLPTETKYGLYGGAPRDYNPMIDNDDK